MLIKLLIGLIVLVATVNVTDANGNGILEICRDGVLSDSCTVCCVAACGDNCGGDGCGDQSDLTGKLCCGKAIREATEGIECELETDISCVVKDGECVRIKVLQSCPLTQLLFCLNAYHISLRLTAYLTTCATLTISRYI
jgi:hypothetical protein